MAEKIVSYKQLEVWKKSHEMVLRVYAGTKKFPDDERYGLVSQMRRAAVSVPANIVEGFRRANKKEKIQFFRISQSSADELSYFLILAKDLKYLETIEAESQMLESIVMMLSAMIRKLEQTG